MCPLGVLWLVLALWSGAKAGVFDTPQTVPVGAYEVGIEHQIWVKPFSFGLFEHLGYGIGGRTDFEIHLGVEAEKPAYIGLDLERRVFGGDRGPMLSVSTGAHYQDSLWVDLRASIGFGFPQLVSYFGVDADIPAREAPEVSAVLFIGVGFTVSPSLEYRFETLFGLDEEDRQGVEIGAVWRF